ncbi:type II secretion system major pseudopilin GspG [Bradyrhizobium yuanmingense]|uniref:type II secretion system major pseudopilin GspG n=1 Tax=Bradyrhizobium yuanmingense TaxID=108015 RepID=UPI0023B9A3DF|nr:type II secretion system major pseudopilin GspG [Bradyrhizobium yuanmingense]MDF0584159.1 type II secretion system major pseudopilin GspG [Bradyrhizobium yuanmingense]
MRKLQHRLNQSTRHLRRHLSQQDGFTLVEMLVVITIIGLVVGLVGPRVLNHLSDSKTKAAKIQIEGLAQALDLYYLDNGSYPTTSVGLAALVQKPSSAERWNGPYLKGNAIPNDPWGKPYTYAFPGTHGPAYDLASLGADGREGGTEQAADIANWQK